MSATPFDDLDSAHEYLRLLAMQVSETSDEIRQEIDRLGSNVQGRQGDALRLVAFKLQQLDTHIAASRAAMNDLRMLRRILVGDRRVPVNLSR